MQTQKVNLKKWLFIGTICLILLIVVIIGKQGKAQDQENLAYYNLYQDARKSYNQKDYDKAFNNYRELLRKPMFYDSITINWEMGRTEINRDNYNEALKYYEKIKNRYPAILMNQTYLKEYGRLLSAMEDDRAEKYLQKVK